MNRNRPGAAAATGTSRAYYNETDPGAVAWLRELIAAGLIADGVVDDRSVTEIRAADLDGFRQVHLFAGIGGWGRALRLADWPDDRPVWAGSCPCQPYSSAGKGLGDADHRNLWPHMFRLVRECRPDVVFGEQVEGAVRHGNAIVPQVAAEFIAAWQEARGEDVNTDPAYVLVFGSRTFADFGLLCEKLELFTADLGRVVIVHGEWRNMPYDSPRAVGADLLAMRWAETVRKCPHQPFPPEFEKYGTPAAFHVRNTEMVQFVAAKPDGFAVAFFDGKSPGTASTIALCDKHKVPLKKVRY